LRPGDAPWAAVKMHAGKVRATTRIQFLNFMVT